VKLAKLNPSSGPIVGTAGSGSDFVKTLGVDEIVDYMSSSIAEDLRKAVTYLTFVLEPAGRYPCTTDVRSGSYGKGEQQTILEKWGDWWEQVCVGLIHEDKLPGS
jgi:NADPH2:quinone reductase